MVLDEIVALMAGEAPASKDGSGDLGRITRKAGETIIRASEPGECLYILEEGEAEIHQGEVFLEAVSPPGIVGEMSLVDDKGRSATVIARSDVTLVPIDQDDFKGLIKQHPNFGLYVMKVMSLRLRLMNARLREAMIDLDEQKRVEKQLQQMATLDFLTGIHNRRSFHGSAENEFARISRYGGAFSILLLDLDHFKSINDRFGHACGDAAIKMFVTAVEKEMRSADVFGRIGGEEFALFLPETELDGAFQIAERIRTRVEGLKPSWDGESYGFTVSVGVAEFQEPDARLEDVIARADQALYMAKEQGRNRVMSNTPEEQEKDTC